MELQEEMSTSDVVLLLSSVPERTSDLVYWLDEARLRYRHGPAFPTLGGLIAHLVDSAPRVDGLLRHAHLDGQTTADVRAAIDPGQDEELPRPLQEALEDFAGGRRPDGAVLDGRQLAGQLPQDSRARLFDPGSEDPPPQACRDHAGGRPPPLLRNRTNGFRGDGHHRLAHVRGPHADLAQREAGRG